MMLSLFSTVSRRPWSFGWGLFWGVVAGAILMFAGLATWNLSCPPQAVSYVVSQRAS